MTTDSRPVAGDRRLDSAPHARLGPARWPRSALHPLRLELAPERQWALTAAHALSSGLRLFGFSMQSRKSVCFCGTIRPRRPPSRARQSRLGAGEARRKQAVGLRLC